MYLIIYISISIPCTGLAGLDNGATLHVTWAKALGLCQNSKVEIAADPFYDLYLYLHIFTDYFLFIYIYIYIFMFFLFTYLDIHIYIYTAKNHIYIYIHMCKHVLYNIASLVFVYPTLLVLCKKKMDNDTIFYEYICIFTYNTYKYIWESF